MAPGLRRVDDDREGAMTVSPLLVAGLYGIPAVVWSIITWRARWYVRLSQSRSLAFRMVPLLGGAFDLHYAVLIGLAGAPPGFPMDPWDQVRSHRHLANQLTWLLIVSLGRHVARLMPTPERRPSPTWLCVNYGLALAAGTADAWMRLRPGASPDEQLAA